MLRFCYVVAVSLLGLGACGGGGEEAAVAQEAAVINSRLEHVRAGPVIGCAMRAEPSLERFDPRRDIIRGPFALVTVARDMPRLSRASYRPRAGRLAAVKLPVGLRAGHSTTMRVGPGHRNAAALIYREQTRSANRVQDGDESVTFKPCTPDTPGFRGGTVGPITGWAGALIVTGPRCLRLQIRADGERQPDIRLPLGRRCQ